MDCNDVASCLAEINAYCTHPRTGHALLVNTESLDDYQSILAQLKADVSKKIIRVSDYCHENTLPRIDEIYAKVVNDGYYVLVGVSQYAMLQGEKIVEKYLSELLQLSVRGYLIVLLNHSQQCLDVFLNRDLRNDRQILLVAGERSFLPQIRLAKSVEACIGENPKKNVKELLIFLEDLSDKILAKTPQIYAVVPFSASIFDNALYSVAQCDSVYQLLLKNDASIAANTQETYGTQEQWQDLANRMLEQKTFAAVLGSIFGSIDNLALRLKNTVEMKEPLMLWYLWLGLKVFGDKTRPYLMEAIRDTSHFEMLEEHIYLDLLNYAYDDPSFWQLYVERKNLLEAFTENLPLLERYCDKTSIYGKAAVYYLTDGSEKEKYAFIRCLSHYDYTEEELLSVTAKTFPEIYSYLQGFSFNSANAKLAEQDAALLEQFTAYFQKYKLQKITNRIHSDFLAEIETNALERPYNRLPSRISILKKKMQGLPNARLFFFDGLGVEYLAYIREKCEKYGMTAGIQIARCELPSITEKNKEFVDIFGQDMLKIDTLDAVKHHNQAIDYQKCKEPVHIFSELEIIDKELRQIESQLLQGNYENAVIVSDHGASRLAVIYEHENQSPLQLDEKAEHSGRCCPSDNDPQIPFAAYEDGYAVLANYERFKGGRKASVEVHGGAALEEVLVPIIVLSKQPKELEIRFVNSLVEIKPKESAAITLFSNIPLKEPYLSVNGKIYSGAIEGDNQHIKFVLPDIKRSRSCLADVYDGDQKLASNLAFRVQTSVARANDKMSL